MKQQLYAIASIFAIMMTGAGIAVMRSCNKQPPSEIHIVYEKERQGGSQYIDDRPSTKLDNDHEKHPTK